MHRGVHAHKGGHFSLVNIQGLGVHLFINCTYLLIVPTYYNCTYLQLYLFIKILFVFIIELAMDIG